MSLATHPTATRPTAPTHQTPQLQAKNNQQRREIEALRDYQRWRQKLDRLPNTLASPATKVGLAILRDTTAVWERQGKTGRQPYLASILAKDMGMDSRAASTVLAEAEQLGVVDIERYSTGVGAGKRDHMKLAVTERFKDDPATWTRETERDPNGKKCACEAGTFVEVRKERVTRFVSLTKCRKCHTVHRTRVTYQPKSATVEGQPQYFETEKEADDLLNFGLQAPQIDPSYWSSNSDFAPVEDETVTYPAPLCTTQVVVEDDPVPPELRERNQWVAWHLEWRKDKWAKVPINPKTGAEAKTNDPATWGSYEQAQAAIGRYEQAGVGYVFSADDPYTGVDLDKCRDPKTGNITAEIWAQLQQLDSYSELSPSETGVHVIVRGTLPPGGNRRDGYELYDQGRYFTITGHRLTGMPTTINERQKELETLHSRLFPPKTAPLAIQQPVSSASDADLLEKAFRSKCGADIRRLFDGDTSAYGDDHSRADLALLKHLAFWTGNDIGRMDRLFRASGLYREKWERSDYRSRTLTCAIR